MSTRNFLKMNYTLGYNLTYVRNPNAHTYWPIKIKDTYQKHVSKETMPYKPPKYPKAEENLLQCLVS